MKWFLIGLLLCSLLGSVPVTGQTQPTELEIEIHRMINEVRREADPQENSLQPLQLYSVLIKVARQHSQDMLERNYFDHISPEGNDVADRVNNAGLEWTAVGENLFWASGISPSQVAEEAVQGWVNSPGHYQNIITDYSYTGIGVASSGDTYYITQVFLNADPSFLENHGQIYDNNQLDNIQPDSNSFHLSTNAIIAIVIVIFVIIGMDARRRNKRYFHRH